MSTTTAPHGTGLWSLLPGSLRSALIVATTTALVAGGILSTSGLRSENSGITGERDGATALNATPAPLATPLQTASEATLGTTDGSRSEAVISVPGDPDDDDGSRGRGFPVFGRYIYAVQGSEEDTTLTRRQLPPEAELVIDRRDGLQPTEISFELDLGSEHKESAIVAYGNDGIAFRTEEIDIVVSPTSYSARLAFDPAVLQVPADLGDTSTREGTSEATEPDGSTRRTDTWTVDVMGREQVQVRGETVDAWVIVADRVSEPGSEEDFRRKRTYWFDPQTGVWVKWQETTSISYGSGFARTSYSANYTATLDRIAPL